MAINVTIGESKPQEKQFPKLVLSDFTDYNEPITLQNQ